MEPLERRERIPIETGDLIETGPMGRALIVRLTQAAALDENTTMLVETPQELRALQGQLFVKTFGPSPEEPLWVLAAGGRARLATEFHLALDPTNGTATLTLFSGELTLTGTGAPVRLTNRADQATITPEGTISLRPLRSAASLNNLVEWLLYYPAVLDLDELRLVGGDELLQAAALEASLNAYRSGNLPEAVKLYFETRGRGIGADAGSIAERIYRAALLIGAGEIGEAEEVLRGLQAGRPSAGNADIQERLVAALFELIAAVKFQPIDLSREPRLATEWMARSYAWQSLSRLREAREAAMRAAQAAQRSGFAFARLAEMEFGFGHTRAAQDALNRALQLSPENAQAYVLQGFAFAAANEPEAAKEAFSRAVSLDARLGDSWLGLGLAELRWGDPMLGLYYLEVAVAQEPQRALLRSYIGKAYQTTGYFSESLKELELAKKMDSRDPTAWLYSALVKHEQNRINEAVRDLEYSQALNDNRSLFRSTLLLDQDRAVRSVNLAALYEDVRLEEVSVREASRAVASDYGNYSAHLFLANSYNALRDPNLVSLRYETAVFSEYMVANLLAPVGGTMLSPVVSRQEYSRLFQRDYLGLTTEAAARTDGAHAFAAVQYGVIENLAYSIEGSYRSLPSQGRGEGLKQTAASVQLKQQFSSADSIYLQAVYNRVDAGDVAQVYDPAEIDPTMRSREIQAPNIFLGYHHEWSPGVHTLFLFANLRDEFRVRSSLIQKEVVQRSGGTIVSRGPYGLPFNWDYSSELEALSLEVQQIWQTDRSGLILGGRFQSGDTENRSDLIATGIGFYNAFQRNRANFRRSTAYAYLQQEFGSSFLATAGFSFDALHYPENISLAPIADTHREVERFSPKLGLIWTPHPAVTGRAAYSRSLGGVFFETSVRLEPTQLVGFPQAFRSLAPESLVGSIPASEFDLVNVGFDFRTAFGSYFGWQLDSFRSEAQRILGAFDYDQTTGNFPEPSGVPQDVDYRENSLSFYFNQLIGNSWSVGARYRLTDSRLKTEHRILPVPEREHALLQECTAFLLFNHPSGIFGSLQGTWIGQDTRRSSRDLRDESFWHFDAYIGYRFARRRAELLLALVNVTDQDYRLNPVSLHPDRPRDRSILTSLRLNF